MTALSPPWPGAVGVSGGGDSVALMKLLTDWASNQGAAPPVVLTVDHGLRPDSHKQAEQVRKLARGMGLPVHVLPWAGAKPSADIEAEARKARYRLMGGWCQANRIGALYLAHTLEDQAETFLLRLARGSGVDGLAAMQTISALPNPEFTEIGLVRPLLEFQRAELRQFLKAQGIGWAEDAMNSDPQFARSRLRAAWPQLESLGLLPARIADAARHLARARAVLDDLTATFLQRGVRYQPGTVLLDPVRLKLLPREIGLRALARVLSDVSGSEYRPRFESLERLFDCILGGRLGKGATLHGCSIGPAPVRDQIFGSATLTISREKGRREREPQASRSRKR